MMWRGRYQLGQNALVGLLVADNHDTPQWPDSAPLLEIRDADGVKVHGGPVPVVDRYGTTGLFQQKIFLGGNFAAGRYKALFSYTLAGVPYFREDVFEVIPGGDPAGAVISLIWNHRPHGEFVIQQLSGGAVAKGVNPRV